MERVSTNKCFAGEQIRFRHTSQTLGCEMIFAAYLPPQALAGQKVPVLYWLSGLTCTDENFTQKAGAQRVAAELGIAPGSTLWYDLEGDFRADLTSCRDSALYFLSAWTKKLHRLGYLSGFYSSAGTGIKMLDDAATLRPGTFAMPDQIWVARWSGTPGRINEPGRTYLRDTSWTPHKRVHQYRGGHNETHGGVTINIDSNYLDLGSGSTARVAKVFCGGVDVDHPAYPTLRRGATGDLVKAAQCLLKQKRVYAGDISGTFDAATVDAVRAYVEVTNEVRAADTPWEHPTTVAEARGGLRHGWEDDPFTAWLGEVDGTVVGVAEYAVIRWDNHHVALAEVRVRPACRRRGHGGAGLIRDDSGDVAALALREDDRAENEGRGDETEISHAEATPNQTGC